MKEKSPEETMRHLSDKVAQSLEAIGIRPEELRIAVALSGGADSVALLLALKQTGAKPTALHCNFSLRGDESDGDEAFCRRLCADHGIDIHVARFDTRGERERGESIEMACRRLRYDWFANMAKDLGVDYVAVAHHHEDTVETVMLNMLRGTGPLGMRGMAARSGLIVRPMLGLTRADIEAYLAAMGVGYRTDSTNLSSDYRRNALRNDIFPAIRQAFPDADRGIDMTISAMSHSWAMLSDFLDIMAERYVDGQVIDVEGIAGNCSDPVATLYMLMRRIDAMGCSMSVAADIVNSRTSSGRQFTTLSGAMFYLSRGKLHPAAEAAEETIAVDITDPSDLPLPLSFEIITPEQFAARRKSANSIFLDADRLDIAGLRLRHRREGDRLYPFGMKGSRKLSDIFTDLHMSIPEKDSVWLLTDGDDRLLWVPGVRASRHYAVTSETRRILCISLQPSPPHPAYDF